MAGVKIDYYFVPFPQEIWDEDVRLTLGEFRLLGYLLRHQIGFGKAARLITDDELLNGIKDASGERRDRGCGIRGINNLKDARDRMVARGWLTVTEDRSDLSRIKRLYAVKLAVSETDNRVSETDTRNTPAGDPKRIVQQSETDTPNKDYRSSVKRGGSVPSTFGAAYTPPAPTELQQIDRGVIAGVQLTEVATAPDAKRPSQRLDTAEFGEPPPVKGQAHPAECSLPGAGKPQTRPVDPGAAEERRVAPAVAALRAVEGAFVPYYGNEPMGRLRDDFTVLFAAQMALGRTISAANITEAIRRRREELKASGQRGKRQFSDEISGHLLDVLEEQEAGESAPTTAPNAPRARTPEMPSQHERIRLEKLWGRSIADNDREGQERAAAGIRSLYEAREWVGPALEKSIRASRDGARDWAQRFQRMDRASHEASLTAAS